MTLEHVQCQAVHSHFRSSRALPQKNNQVEIRSTVVAATIVFVFVTVVAIVTLVVAVVFVFAAAAVVVAAVRTTDRYYH